MPTFGGPTRAICAAPSRRTAIESRWTAFDRTRESSISASEPLAQVRVRTVLVVGQLREQCVDLADPVPALFPDEPALRHLGEGSMRHRHRDLPLIRGNGRGARSDHARRPRPSRPFHRRLMWKGPISRSAWRSWRPRRPGDAGRGGGSSPGHPTRPHRIWEGRQHRPRRACRTGTGADAAASLSLAADPSPLRGIVNG